MRSGPRGGGRDQRLSKGALTPAGGSSSRLGSYSPALGASSRLCGVLPTAPSPISGQIRVQDQERTQDPKSGRENSDFKLHFATFQKSSYSIHSWMSPHRGSGGASDKVRPVSTRQASEPRTGIPPRAAQPTAPAEPVGLDVASMAAQVWPAVRGYAEAGKLDSTLTPPHPPLFQMHKHHLSVKRGCWTRRESTFHVPSDRNSLE